VKLIFLISILVIIAVLTAPSAWAGQAPGAASEPDVSVSVDESWLRRESHKAQLPVQPLAEELVARERQLIEAALGDAKGRVSGPSGAAAKLGIPGSTLESKSPRHIVLPRDRHPCRRIGAQSSRSLRPAALAGRHESCGKLKRCRTA